MARQLRIEYPGAFYHITSRGNQKQPIFFADRDRVAFLDYLRGAHLKFSSVVHAYCLMENHYHLLLETPLGNLSNIMHYINTSYSVFFNTTNSRVGHLFQGRFKAILIEAESYAQELSRYIHLNPVRAKIVSVPEDYRWSSYREYLGMRPKPLSSWLCTALILGYFGQEPISAKIQYAAFVAEAIGRPIENPLQIAGILSILGSKDFIDRIKNRYLSDRPENREVPGIRRLKNRPALELIQRAAEQILGMSNRFARNVAIFVCRNNTDYTLKEIAEFYRIGKSAIGKISFQMRETLTLNESLDRAVEEIEKSLF